MNNTQMFHLSLVAAIALLAGCNASPNSASNSKPESSQKALEKVQVETKETAKAIKDYAHAQRADYVKEMKLALSEAKRDLDQIAMQAKKSSNEVKARAEPRIAELRLQISKLETQLESVNDATVSTWSSVKSGFSSAYESTKTGLNEARQWVSDAIEPKETL